MGKAAELAARDFYRNARNSFIIKGGGYYSQKPCLQIHARDNNNGKN